MKTRQTDRKIGEFEEEKKVCQGLFIGSVNAHLKYTLVTMLDTNRGNHVWQESLLMV